MAVCGFGEGVDDFAFGVEVAQGEELVGRFEVREAVDFLKEGSALGNAVAFVVEACSSSS